MLTGLSLKPDPQKLSVADYLMLVDEDTPWPAAIGLMAKHVVNDAGEQAPDEQARAYLMSIPFLQLKQGMIDLIKLTMSDAVPPMTAAS